MKIEQFLEQECKQQQWLTMETQDSGWTISSSAPVDPGRKLRELFRAIKNIYGDQVDVALKQPASRLLIITKKPST